MWSNLNDENTHSRPGEFITDWSRWSWYDRVSVYFWLETTVMSGFLNYATYATQDLAMRTLRS